MTVRGICLTVLTYLLVTVLGWSHPFPAVAQVRVEQTLAEERITFDSDVLDEERRVFVRLPEGYETSERLYPVLYLMDGEFFFQQGVAAVHFLSELPYIRQQSRIQPIPQMIVVGVVNVDRNRDYTPTHAPQQGQARFPTSGGAGEFHRFLETELFPLIEDRYRTQPYRALAGWSLGGLFTVHTFLDRPDLFSAYMAISPSLWWDNRLVVQRADSLRRGGAVTGKPLVVTLGALEGTGMSGPVRDGFVATFEGESSDETAITYVEIPGEIHMYVYYKALLEGLRALYSEWVMPNSILAGGLEAVKDFYEDLSARWGYQVDIPEAAYSQLASALAGQGDQDSALEIAELAVQRYPHSSLAHYRLGRWLHRMGDLESARESYLRALVLETGYQQPDSERLLAIQSRLRDLERENQ
jgi:predicted alpha/beta superfamily hydrolase